MFQNRKCNIRKSEKEGERPKEKARNMAKIQAFLEIFREKSNQYGLQKNFTNITVKLQLAKRTC